MTTSTWDYENQVQQVENYQGEVVTYTYGIVTQTPDQKRIAKNDGFVEIRYRWDADNLAQETDDVGTVAAEYTLQPMAQGNLVSQYRELESSYYHYDGRTNTARLTDSAEVVTNEYVLDAWGGVVAETAYGIAAENDFLFMGQKQVQRDAAFGAKNPNYWARARQYDPKAGRFRSEDPIRDDESNLYRYVGNDPVNGIDPTGKAGFTPGTATCAKTPGLYDLSYVPRGMFAVATVSEYVADEDYYSRIGSKAYAKWKPGPASQFIDQNGCCCCDTAGVVQTYKYSVIYSNGDLKHDSAQWYLDSSIPYPYGRTASPCSSPTDPGVLDPIVEMKDMPNAPEFYSGYGSRVLKYQASFETCVVCLSGREGYTYRRIPEYGDIPLLNWRVTGIVVYGCFKWGHRLEWSKDNDEYTYVRYLGESSQSGNSGLEVSNMNFTGNPPSSDWKDAVLLKSH